MADDDLKAEFAGFAEDFRKFVDAVSTYENRVVRMLKELQVIASNTDGKLVTVMGDMDDLKQSLLNITKEEEIQETIDDATGKITEQTEEMLLEIQKARR